MIAASVSIIRCVLFLGDSNIKRLPDHRRHRNKQNGVLLQQ